MAETPTAAFILSLLGGIFVLLPGLALAALGTFLAIFTYGAGLILWVFPLFGVIIILGSVLMYVSPSSTKMWGIVVLILGVLSFVGIVTALGGLLALIGGILAIVWKPAS